MKSGPKKKGWEEPSISISEIFHSIQGEGPNAGVPSIFVRTAGCNLRCDFCDTPYALKKEQGTPMLISEILKELKKFNCSRVVWTGGEPAWFIKAIKNAIDWDGGKHVHELETNGTIMLGNMFPSYFDLVVVSPKKGLIRGKVIRELNSWAEEGVVRFKFVIENVDDLKYWTDFCQKFEIRPEHVFMMPEGRTREELQKKYEMIAEVCKRFGFNFSPRLQILIWGNRRGV